MSWTNRDLNPGPLAPLPSALPLDQGAKKISLKKFVFIEFNLYPNVLELYTAKFISVKYHLPHGLGVVSSARVQEVRGSNPGETRT